MCEKRVLPEEERRKKEERKKKKETSKKQDPAAAPAGRNQRHLCLQADTGTQANFLR